MSYRYLFFPLFLIALAACGGAGSATATPLPTVAAMALDMETATVAPPATDQPADTPLPPAATDTPEPEPSATATTVAIPTPASDEEPLALIVKLSNGANLRAGPDTDYAIIGEIKAGQEVFLQAQNPVGDWIQLDMEGEGQTWIAAFLLELPAGLDLPIATNIPLPSPPPTPGDSVSIVQSSITIPTYPWQEFTSAAIDETTGWEYQRFDQAAYEASNPQPSPLSYRLVILENQWLRLSLMPDLGGRLYQMIFKPTGSNELYQNPVIKPSPWGPEQQGNGWLAAGGIEWGLPVVEHGYAWGERWGFITEPVPPAGSVTLFDKAQEQIHLNVDVGLEPDSAALMLDLTFENRGDEPVDAAFWLNAMLAPGPANHVGPDLRFIIPGDIKQVHSTGESDLPGKGGLFDWPLHNGRDISRLGSWQRWLGFFAHPQAQANWAAVYDLASDEGVVRIFPPQIIPGVKSFGLGWGQAIDPGNFTDDGSTYVELQGGLTPTFSEQRKFSPGDQVIWRELWYPVAGIGGITAADGNGAVHLTHEGDELRLRIFSTTTRSGDLIVNDAQGELLRFNMIVDPASPADILLPPAQPPISFQFVESDGSIWQMGELFP